MFGVVLGLVFEVCVLGIVVLGLGLWDLGGGCRISGFGREDERFGSRFPVFDLIAADI